jgi:PPOX class probable F420-dependent enzyme
MGTDHLPAGLLELVAMRNWGVLATLKRDGRPQLSNVNYAWDAPSRSLRVSVTDGRAKVANLRRDPRASMHVTARDGWPYTVLEGTAELSVVAADPQDATVEELVDLFRAVQGEHPDWDDYRRAMVADRRLVLRIVVDRAYGILPRR